MTSKTFVSGTVIDSTWLNDVDGSTYQGQLDDGTPNAAVDKFAPSGTGAVTRTVQAKLRDSVSVKDFGAVGDGIADDYAAIMVAHDALPSAGGEIRVPRGSYLHNTAITFSKNIRLVGEGTAQDHRVSPSEFVKGAGITTTGVTFTGNGATVQNMAFRGITGNTGDGVCLLAARQVLRDVGVFNMGGNGVRVGIDSPSTYNCNLWYIENLHSKNNGANGLEVSEGAGAYADSNAGTAIHLDLQNNTLNGLYIRGSQLGNYFAVTCQTNGAFGVRLGPDAKYNTIVGGDWEGNASGQLRLDDGAEFNNIQNHTIAATSISQPDPQDKNDIRVVGYSSLSGGLTFPRVPDATPFDAYTLNGYESYTFTPTVSGTTIAGAATTYVSRIGKYTRIGNMLHFAIQVEWSGGHTGTGNTIITGLPFASLNTGPITPVTIWQVGGPIPAAGTVRVAMVYNNTSQVALRETNLTTMAVTNSNAITASGTFLIQGSYFIS